MRHHGGVTVTARPATASDAPALASVAALTFPLACPPGTALDRQSRTTLPPLGEALSSGDDAGTRFVPEADGRLRRTAALTVQLRNHAGPP